VKRFVFEYCEVWRLDVSFDQVNINDQDSGAMSSKYPDNHDNHECSQKAIQRSDTSKSLEASARNCSKLGVYIDQLEERADAMLRTRFQQFM
jgi:hypothetical protein